MYKFYCPVCNNKEASVSFADDVQMESLPAKHSKSEQQAYMLNFLCCNQCKTVISVVPIPYTGDWNKD